MVEYEDKAMVPKVGVTTWRKLLDIRITCLTCQQREMGIADLRTGLPYSNLSVCTHNTAADNHP